MQILQILQYAALFAAVLSVGSVIRQRDTISTLEKNNVAYKERIDLLEGETKRCAADHLISQGQIKELKEQVREFKDLPLKQIQQTQAGILQTQKQIVQILGKIEHNQPNAAVVAGKVEQVKVDLQNKKEK